MAYIGNRPFDIMLASLLGAERPATEEELTCFLRGLLTADWEANDGAIRLKRDLTIEQVVGSILFDQTRVFLRTLIEDKGAPLTKTGNLNRAVILRLVERMAWPRRAVEDCRRVFPSKKFDEWDVPYLQYIRAISECAGLAVKRRERLLATKRTIALCDDALAGPLFHRLFTACFRRFNLGFLGGMPETPGVQYTIAVIFWRLSLKANDWIAAGKLPEEVFLPTVSAEIQHLNRWEGAEASALLVRVLEPLTWFGLLETDTPKDDHPRPSEDRKFRKTPLFDQFLSFVFKP